jgi:hypothetical protein
MALPVTTRDMMTGALRLINVVQANEVPTATDMDIALYSLDSMIDSWSNNRLMIYSINEYNFTLTGATSYTLGPGGDFNVERPMAVEQCYARLHAGSPQQLDIAMQPLTDAQYAGIAVKNTTSSFPFAFYDDRAYPLRTITKFPVPGPGNELAMWLREPLLDLTSLDAVVDFPPGYERALRYNLACELAPEFGKTVQMEVSQRALAGIADIQRLNSVPRYIKGDGGMTRNGRNRYFNWITGNFWSFGNN